MSLIGSIIGTTPTPPPAPSPTPTPTPTPTPAPTPPPAPAPSPSPTVTPPPSSARRVRVEANAAPPRRWGEAGGLSLSPAAVKAAQRLRVTFARAPEAAAPLPPKAAARAAADIVRDAALSLIAQANVDRRGAVSLLLK